MKSYAFKTSRMRFITLFANWMMQRYLMWRAKQFMHKGHDQLVVYSFDLIGNAIIIGGLYEEYYLKAILGYIETYFPEQLNKTFVDVGANVGNHSLFYSKFFRSVIAYEPNPKTFKILELNASLRKNIEVRRWALGSSNCLSPLHLNTLNQGAASLLKDPNSTNSSMVEVREMDSEHLKSLGLLKIDVEGQELDVIQGARETLSREQPIVLVEVNAGKFNDKRVLLLMRELGYSSPRVVSGATITGLSIFGYVKSLCTSIVHPYCEIKQMEDVDFGAHHNLIIFVPDMLLNEYQSKSYVQ